MEGSTKQKPRPLRKDKNCVEDKSVGIAKTTWKPKIKSSSSSSENSEESSSSSDDDTGKNNRHAQVSALGFVTWISLTDYHLMNAIFFFRILSVIALL